MVSIFYLKHIVGHRFRIKLIHNSVFVLERFSTYQTCLKKNQPIYSVFWPAHHENFSKQDRNNTFVFSISVPFNYFICSVDVVFLNSKHQAPYFDARAQRRSVPH